ncbi:MAG: hypothetical protein BGP01_04970 [Paludibacter sp. 47-17]|nr:MAG: hypothetical protein BGP01_04970 [Paludibacter sp. 47-17]
MIKDFFYFSGAQRTGIIVLFVLLLIGFIAVQLVPVFVAEPVIEIDDPGFIDDVRAFEASLERVDTVVKQWRRPAWQAPAFRNYASRSANEVSAAELFPFDPNTLDSAGLVQLGIPRHVVKNILRYRLKGGYYATAQRFSETYGLSPDLFARLHPYILIESTKITQLKIPDAEASDPVPVELNAADSTQLMSLKGVGRGIALSILRFRKASGGFVQIDQLREVYGMTGELFARIQPWIRVDSTTITKIKVNAAGVDKLRAHPYLNFYQAKAIYELRRKKGRLSSLYELRNLEELDSVTVRKIAAYLSFE